MIDTNDPRQSIGSFGRNGIPRSRGNTSRIGQKNVVSPSQIDGPDRHLLRAQIDGGLCYAARLQRDAEPHRIGRGSAHRKTDVGQLQSSRQQFPWKRGRIGGDRVGRSFRFAEHNGDIAAGQLGRGDVGQPLAQIDPVRP